MKLVPIMNEDELAKFYLKNCKLGVFLKFLYDECIIKLISYYESASNIDFGQFIESRSIFNIYVVSKYNLMLSEVNLTNYFCNLNRLDVQVFFDL